MNAPALIVTPPLDALGPVLRSGITFPDPPDVFTVPHTPFSLAFLNSADGCSGETPAATAGATAACRLRGELERCGGDAVLRGRATGGDGGAHAGFTLIEEEQLNSLSLRSSPKMWQLSEI